MLQSPHWTLTTPRRRIVTLLIYVVVVGGTLYACGLLIDWLWVSIT